MEMETGRKEDRPGQVDTVDGSVYLCPSCEKYYLSEVTLESHACPGGWDQSEKEAELDSDPDSGYNESSSSPSQLDKSVEVEPIPSSVMKDIASTMDCGDWDSKSEDSDSEDVYEEKLAKLEAKRQRQMKDLSAYINCIIDEKKGIQKKMFDPAASQEKQAEWARKILVEGTWELHWMSEWARDNATAMRRRIAAAAKNAAAAMRVRNMKRIKFYRN